MNNGDEFTNFGQDFEGLMREDWAQEEVFKNTIHMIVDRHTFLQEVHGTQQDELLDSIAEFCGSHDASLRIILNNIYNTSVMGTENEFDLAVSYPSTRHLSDGAEELLRLLEYEEISAKLFGGDIDCLRAWAMAPLMRGSIKNQDHIFDADFYKIVDHKNTERFTFREWAALRMLESITKWSGLVIGSQLRRDEEGYLNYIEITGISKYEENPVFERFHHTVCIDSPNSLEPGSWVSICRMRGSEFRREAHQFGFMMQEIARRVDSTGKLPQEIASTPYIDLDEAIADNEQ